MTKRVLLGEIGRPHGVRGLVRLHTFTSDPRTIGSYGALTDATGMRRFAVTVMPGGLAHIEGVTDRNAAARLTGTKLYVERDNLPAPADPDEFLLCDLEGLAAVGEDGTELGTVRSIEEYGAGPFLVIQGADRVAKFLGHAGLAPMPVFAEQPKKSAPKKKAQERAAAAAAAAAG